MEPSHLVRSGVLCAVLVRSARLSGAGFLPSVSRAMRYDNVYSLNIGVIWRLASESNQRHAMHGGSLTRLKPVAGASRPGQSDQIRSA
jgi:hypothetical protein